MVAYATPEWVAAMGENYRSNPDNAGKIFKGITMFLVFRIQADPKFGLGKDIDFGTHLVDGVLQEDSTLMNAADSERKADFILSASPHIWKRVITKKEGFVAAFMGGKIKLDKGEAPKIIALASRSPAVVEAFNRVPTEWPDEMTPEQLEAYKVQVKEFRERLGL
ncbi:MAG: SCP2 sterol-binding domain-containing protein [Dehalococcoidia bacterium]|nr:SCP2 sterol-binding domain-containing protein [Dehalococcoidia bacterium]